jgi:hypothetical protein
MGTDYGLGPIVSFRVESDTTLSLENWTEILSQRIDLSLFDLTLNEKELTGKINAQIFKENILDFFSF